MRALLEVHDRRRLGRGAADRVRGLRGGGRRDVGKLNVATRSTAFGMAAFVFVLDRVTKMLIEANMTHGGHLRA